VDRPDAPFVPTRQRSSHLSRLILSGPLGRYRRALSFVIVGGGVALLGYVLLFLLVDLLHVEQNLAYFIQAIVAIEANFLLNRSLTWRSSALTWRAFAWSWGKFHLAKVGTVALNQALFGALVFLGTHYLAANTVCLLVGMLVNYILNDRFVFRAAVKEVRS
jgi:putative flippase GtrA